MSACAREARTRSALLRSESLLSMIWRRRSDGSAMRSSSGSASGAVTTLPLLLSVLVLVLLLLLLLLLLAALWLMPKSADTARCSRSVCGDCVRGCDGCDGCDR